MADQDQLQTLLEAIAVAPGDDAAWLALADCLEEQGRQEEAELTRHREWLRHAALDDPERAGRERKLQGLIAAGVRPVMPRRSFALEEGVSLEMVLIPPGSFWMGSPDSEKHRFDDEGPRHHVTLTQGFWLGVYPVTRQQWSTGLRPGIGRLWEGELPIDGVSWSGTARLCRALAKQTGSPFTLPTEAQWEYACRAGTTSSAYTGAGSIKLSQAAWFQPNSSNKPHRVGEKLPNAWGLFDMLGNVWEWCSDGLRHYRDRDETDPRGRRHLDRVIRGGCWHQTTRCCRCATRTFHPAHQSDVSLGCRLCLPLS